MRFNTHFTLYVSIMALCVIAMAQVSASNLRDPAGDRQQFKRVTVSKPNRVWYRDRGENKLLTTKNEAVKYKNNRGQMQMKNKEHEGTVLGSRALKEEKAKKSKVPKVPKTTKVPKATKVPNAPKAPKFSKVPT